MERFKCTEETFGRLLCMALIDYTDNQLDAEQAEFVVTMIVGLMVITKGMDFQSMTEVELLTAINVHSEEEKSIEDMIEFYQEFNASDFNSFIEAFGQGMECLRSHFVENFNIGSTVKEFRVEFDELPAIEFTNIGYGFY